MDTSGQPPGGVAPIAVAWLQGGKMADVEETAASVRVRGSLGRRARPVLRP